MLASVIVAMLLSIYQEPSPQPQEPPPVDVRSEQVPPDGVEPIEQLAPADELTPTQPVDPAQEVSPSQQTATEPLQASEPATAPAAQAKAAKETLVCRRRLAPGKGLGERARVQKICKTADEWQSGGKR